MRVGIQFASDSRGVGVIGVVDASFLTPTHNKQDFVQNNMYPLFHYYYYYYFPLMQNKFETVNKYAKRETEGLLVKL